MVVTRYRVISFLEKGPASRESATRRGPWMLKNLRQVVRRASTPASDFSLAGRNLPSSVPGALTEAAIAHHARTITATTTIDDTVSRPACHSLNRTRETPDSADFGRGRTLYRAYPANPSKLSAG